MSYMTITSQENHHFSLCSYFHAHHRADSLLLLPLTPAAGGLPLSFRFFYCHLSACVHIVNRLDHCSSVYCGLPQVRLQPLDGVLRAAARMIGGVPRFGHISEFMRDTLHWLPVRQRIHYRLSTIVW